MKSSLPYLALRSEYSFRKAIGSPEDLAAKVVEQKIPAAGLVDPNTWGTVQWSRALADTETDALFGAELPVAVPEGETKKPTAWILAEKGIRFLYRAVSHEGEPDAAWWTGLEGVIRFAGAALSDPETFDYVDLRPGSLLALERSLRLSRDTGKPTALAVSCRYPRPENRAAFLALTGDRRMRLEHVPSFGEVRSSFSSLSEDDFLEACRGACEVAERCRGVELRQVPMIDFPGDLRAEVEEGIRYRLEHGHIAEWTDEYSERVEREIHLIEAKGFPSYFLVVGDMVRYAKKHMLVGPARGSAAGSLVSYLLQITEVDPIVHGLLFERFIDVNRGGHFYSRDFYDSMGIKYD